MAFNELRDKLAEDGFFKREPLKEAWALFQVVALYASGTFLAYSHPIIATILLGLGMEQAGWLGHDYVHGRGPWCDLMRYMPTLLNGHTSSIGFITRPTLVYTLTRVFASLSPNAARNAAPSRRSLNPKP